MTPAILKSLRAMSYDDYETIMAEAQEIVALAQRGISMVNAFNTGVELSAALAAEHTIQRRIDASVEAIRSAVTLVQSGAALAAQATSLERTLEERT